MEIRRVELLASAVQKQRSTSELYPPWAILDLNQRLLSYQDSALTTELIALLEKHFMEQLDNVNWNSKKIVGELERSPSDKSPNRRRRSRREEEVCFSVKNNLKNQNLLGLLKLLQKTPFLKFLKILGKRWELKFQRFISRPKETTTGWC